jgi:hypothetical protein
MNIGSANTEATLRNYSAKVDFASIAAALLSATGSGVNKRYRDIASTIPSPGASSCTLKKPVCGHYFFAAPVEQ